jgi:NAD-dependent DNA ligase
MALKNAGVRSNVYEILLNVEIRDMIAECFNAFTKVNLWFFQEIKVLDLPKFCISGKLSFGTKEQFAKKVGVHRYQMVSFVDKTIEFLISNEKSTSKVLKAEKLGIPVYSEQEAIEKFGGE